MHPNSLKIKKINNEIKIGFWKYKLKNKLYIIIGLFFLGIYEKHVNPIIVNLYNPNKTNGYSIKNSYNSSKNKTF
jgi:hypothetical protein